MSWVKRSKNGYLAVDSHGFHHFPMLPMFPGVASAHSMSHRSPSNVTGSWGTKRLLRNRNRKGPLPCLDGDQSRARHERGNVEGSWWSTMANDMAKNKKIQTQTRGKYKNEGCYDVSVQKSGCEIRWWNGAQSFQPPTWSQIKPKELLESNDQPGFWKLLKHTLFSSLLVKPKVSLPLVDVHQPS